MSEPFVFEVDTKKSSCAVCIDGILGAYCPYSFGREKRKPIYYWKDRSAAPPGEILERLLRYHLDPECEAELHQWFEDLRRTEALEFLESAAKKFAEIDAREPGWSIKEWGPKP